MSIIIVGGGMTGATLALTLSTLTQGKLPVHLVEAVAPQSTGHPGFDGRAIALAQGTCQQLARSGIWQAIADCATAIETVHVSDRGHAGFGGRLGGHLVLGRGQEGICASPPPPHQGGDAQDDNEDDGCGQEEGDGDVHGRDFMGLTSILQRQRADGADRALLPAYPQANPAAGRLPGWPRRSEPTRRRGRRPAPSSASGG